MRLELRARSTVVLGIVLSLVTGLPAVAANPERDAYFGETHVHTSWSLDAFAIGNLLTNPGDAYKYFKGEPIKHPLGYDVKIDTPLDWAGVTDHSEYAGVVNLANEPGSAVSKLSVAQPLILKARTKEEMERVALYAINTLASGPPVPALMAPEIAGTVWKRNVALADQANEPGKFTAFCSYEWTSMPNNMNLHRNIFFKDCAKVPPMPFSALDSKHPVDLWDWMDGQRKAGNDLLAISHNANLSDGRMFPTEVDTKGRPIDAAYAASRTRNEPLIEIKQLKGTSETHPLLSPNDEFASFEIMSVLLGNPPGRIPHIVGSYARQALKDGLTMQDTEGFNPYKFGFGAASDSHNTAVPYRQDNFFGGHSFTDGTIEARMSGNLVGGMFDARTEGTSGLTGVWAEENTRAALFEGMSRKETFAVTGPHIKVRVFGGWEYTPDMLADKDWVKTGYAKGVPMGGDLPPATGKAPAFMVWAVKDPTSGNLDRIQIVKGWTKSGQSYEKIFDVVWAGDRKPDKWTGVVPPIGSTVDIEKATYENTIGSVELKTVWSDPEFDPSLHAFYYARVLEIPTPRWTTIQAAKLGIAPPDVVAPTLQERAWSSPIWYTPSAEARKAAKPGTTVADLKKQGAMALNDDQLKTLIVEKSVWLQNTVTGEKYMIIYGALGKGTNAKPLTPADPGYVTQHLPVNQGQFQVRYVGRNVAMQSLTGDAAGASYLGGSRTYNINKGKIVIELEGTPIEVSVYKLGDKYVGARSNEFGYANYEIVPHVGELNPLEASAKPSKH
ncbi:MAG: DUF3604 domain-containing protein [Deltaproteobacteria bacterium]|nr:DUF3604 domain-containing protein [Deltaproteobacteria bacterium]MBI3390193.1 DUF3604 domain-containing protein [Deltaproteobacteria bacterium]